jgi:spore maturation protein CgeB
VEQPTPHSSSPSKGKYVSAAPEAPAIYHLVNSLKITFFGLTISSSWGNGHATPYRAILRALDRRGVHVSFYEKNLPYYERHRDFDRCEYCDLELYSDWESIRTVALRDAGSSDVVVIGSYTPEGARIIDDLLELDNPQHVFYDLDTPVTLSRLAEGPLDYLRLNQIAEFDLYLSFTGGSVLQRLEEQYGARIARPLYGCVDPDVYHRVAACDSFHCALSYVGTYAPDRQEKLDDLFLAPSRQRTDLQFLLAGSLYPFHWTWPENVTRFDHVAPGQHSALYSSSRATLNITRREMAASGYCPSGRFFEAAACGTPILTDHWEGLDSFFDVQHELKVVRTSEDVLAALNGSEEELQSAAERARERTLQEHTGERRAEDLLKYCEEAYRHRSLAAEVQA